MHSNYPSAGPNYSSLAPGRFLSAAAELLRVASTWPNFQQRFMERVWPRSRSSEKISVVASKLLTREAFYVLVKTLRRFRHLFPLNPFCEVSKYQIGVVFEDYGREYGILLLSALYSYYLLNEILYLKLKMTTALWDQRYSILET